MAKQQINGQQNLLGLVDLKTKTTSSLTSGTSQVQVSGFSSTFTVPTGGGTYDIEAYFSYIYANTNAYTEIGIWDGTVGSGTQLGWLVTYGTGGSASSPQGGSARTVVSLSAGSHTINIGISASAGTGQGEGQAGRPAFLKIMRIA